VSTPLQLFEIHEQPWSPQFLRDQFVDGAGSCGWAVPMKSGQNHLYGNALTGKVGPEAVKKPNPQNGFENFAQLEAL
jgi:hypothetical protein